MRISISVSDRWLVYLWGSDAAVLMKWWPCWLMLAWPAKTLIKLVALEVLCLKLSRLMKFLSGKTLWHRPVCVSKVFGGSIIFGFAWGKTLVLMSWIMCSRLKTWIRIAFGHTQTMSSWWQNVGYRILRLWELLPFYHFPRHGTYVADFIHHQGLLLDVSFLNKWKGTIAEWCLLFAAVASCRLMQQTTWWNGVQEHWLANQSHLNTLFWSIVIALLCTLRPITLAPGSHPAESHIMIWPWKMLMIRELVAIRALRKTRVLWELDFKNDCWRWHKESTLCEG